MWPGQDPLGRQLVFKGGSSPASTKTIVGVSRDVRDTGSRLTARSELYVPFADEPVPVIRIVVKTAFSAEQMAPVIRQEAAAIDPRLPVGDVEPVTAIVARSVATWRFAASLLATFAGIAATLAAVGLFAVVGWLGHGTHARDWRAHRSWRRARYGAAILPRAWRDSDRSWASRAASRWPRSPRASWPRGSSMPAHSIVRRSLRPLARWRLSAYCQPTSPHDVPRASIRYRRCGRRRAVSRSPTGTAIPHRIDSILVLSRFHRRQ